MTDVCRSCEAPIRWAMTRKNRRHPLNAEPSENGVWWIDSTGVMRNDAPPKSGDVALYESHFATCPNADQHRRLR